MSQPKKKVSKPQGQGWYQVSGGHWERMVEDKNHPCGYCGCTTFVESTYSWPYCQDCKSV